MNAKKFSDAMSELDSKYIDEALNYKKKAKKPVWVKWGAMAACLCFVICIGTYFAYKFNPDGGGFGNGDATLFAEHREDFSSEIPSDILAQLGDNTIKAYLLRTNDWFLATDMTDYSQALTNDVLYIVQDTSNGERGAYTAYTEEDGAISKDHDATPPANATVPCGFFGLTYPMIEDDISEIDYIDYIVTYSTRLRTVIVWVQRSEEDLFVTYPTRPDLLEIEVGGIYTLPEMQEKLTDAYHK